MKIIAVIPARYASTRFPAKLMQDLGGKTVILRTYQAAVNTNLFADVFVVTDSEIIYNEIINNNGKAIMSLINHESGSDRIAEAIENIDCDNVSISIDTDSSEEADKLFNGLSAGGNIKMSLQKTFWGAYFGMFEDKFGIHWMINFDEKK